MGASTGERPRGRARVEPEAGAAAEAPRRVVTTSGILIETLYEPPLDGDLARIGRPGAFPFTRGIHRTMYRGRLWTMRQYAGFASARETNRRFRYLLDHGQAGLSVAFDLPTQIGYDSDHPLARGEVGRVGVAVNTLADFEALLEGIPLERVSISMTINATAAVLFAMLLSLAARQRVPKEAIGGTVQNDILKEYAARGTFRFPVVPSMRLVTDLFAFAGEAAPNFHPISVSGYHMREAGATAVQEVAFTLANGLAYLEAARARGLDLEAVGRRVSFFFNAHNHLFEEVAKFRAARRLWARLLRERFAVFSPEATRLRFHAQTAGSMLTSQQPDNNVVRVTVQALAAILGGTQSLHANARDEATSLPSEASARLALRTQQILATESGVADTSDPLGGSPFVERLTDEIEVRARAGIEEIDRMGGAVAAIESGWMQREIHKSALAWQREVEAGRRPVVGVNCLLVEESEPPPVFRAAEGSEREVLRSLESARGRRDRARHRDALEALEGAARGEENLGPRVLEAVEAYASIGEICERLERVFGRYVSPSVL